MIEAGLGHAPVLALMHRTAFPADPWDTASFLTLLQQPGIRGLVDERGGFLLLRAVLDEAEILTLGVTVRRQGIGRELLQAAIDQVRRQQITRLHLEVAETNTAARALYAGFGFARAGRRDRYYPDGTAALTLTLGL
ncbi:MAG: hypothetical protein B7Z80_01145 [Rhodospirillales bacterium 20-64-7]|nr:MAG: hypothetical protein B7Z80_01145 [Rhodospirillales bacterium 20-64-7]